MAMNSKLEIDKISLDVHHNDSCLYFLINDSYDITEYVRRSFIFDLVMPGFVGTQNGFICIKNSNFINGYETKKYVLEKISDPKFVLSENGQFYMMYDPEGSDLKFFYQGKDFITRIKQRSRKNKILKLTK